MKIARILLACLLVATPLWGQEKQQVMYTGGVPYTTAIPTDCTNGMNYNGTVFTCAPAPVALPAGTIILITSGTCGTGFTEVAALNGKTLIGTVAANGDVGTTGGSDTITPTVASLTAAGQTFNGSSANTNGVSGGTPAGTVTAPTISWPAGVPTHTGTTATFSGSALGTHAHELPFQGGTTPRLTAGYGTGSTIAATRSLTNAALTTSGAVLLSQAVSAGTPAGTVNITSQGTIAWPAGVPTNSTPSFSGSALGTHQHTLTATGTNSTSNVTGTLNQFDNRSAYAKVIFCAKS